MYNPYQYNLIRQKAMIEQQLQQLNQIPPININNQFSQLPQNNTYDFNGKWVADETEAKQTASNNLPLILFDKERPLFYMKSSDGTLKKYSFTEISEEKKNNDIENRVNQLDNKLNKLLQALGEKENKSINQPNEQQRPTERI